MKYKRELYSKIVSKLDPKRVYFADEFNRIIEAHSHDKNYSGAIVKGINTAGEIIKKEGYGPKSSYCLLMPTDQAVKLIQEYKTTIKKKAAVVEEKKEVMVPLPNKEAPVVEKKQEIAEPKKTIIFGELSTDEKKCVAGDLVTVVELITGGRITEGVSPFQIKKSFERVNDCVFVGKITKALSYVPDQLVLKGDNLIYLVGSKPEAKKIPMSKDRVIEVLSNMLLLLQDRAEEGTIDIEKTIALFNEIDHKQVSKMLLTGLEEREIEQVRRKYAKMYNL